MKAAAIVFRGLHNIMKRVSSEADRPTAGGSHALIVVWPVHLQDNKASFLSPRVFPSTAIHSKLAFGRPTSVDLIGRDSLTTAARVH